MRKKIAFSIFLVVGIYLIVVLARDLWGVLAARQRLTEAEERVAKLAYEQEKLQSELERVETDEFIEQEARNKLLLGKAGEMVVLLPPFDSSQSQSVEEEKPSLANWQKWLKLFWD